MKEERCGVITAFFSLVFVMILMLTGTTLYAAFMAGAKNVGERILTLAGESVLAAYYRPLYEEYHIFARVFPGADRADTRSRLEDEFREWMMLNLLPGAAGVGEGFLSGQEPGSVRITDMDDIWSGGGERFLVQALSYQQYRSLSDAAGRLLGLSGTLESTAAAIEVLEKKNEAEEAYVEAAMLGIELMERIDGVEWRSSFLFFPERVSAADVFVKRFWTGEVTPQNLGINHPEIYEEVSGQYIRADEMIDGACQAAAKAGRLAAREEALESELEGIRREIEAWMREQEDAQEQEEEVPEGVRAREEIQGKDEQEQLGEQIKEREELSAELERNIRQTGNERRQLESEAIQTISRLELLADSVLLSIEETNDLMERMEIQMQAAEAVLDLFEAALLAAEPLLEEEFAAQLREEADLLRSQGGSGYDLEGGSRELARRGGILAEMRPLLAEAKEEIARSGYTAAEGYLMRLKELADLMVWQGPSFDYSGYSPGEEIEDPVEIWEDLIHTGIASVVLPEDAEVSDKRLAGGSLPSDWGDAAADEKAEVSFDAVFGFPIDGMVQSAVERLLFTEYAGAHFQSYGRKGKERETVLDYEMEYLLCGNGEDQENLSQTIVRIVLLRALINLVDLASDSQARTEASALAKTASIFTGIPVLTLLFTTMLLILWAAALALTETAVMLTGKSLPVLPERRKRLIRFDELFTLTPSGIKSRAKEYESADTGLRAGYEEYVRLLLLTRSEEVLNYRSMDLIETNIREWYDGEFRMMDCICGFDVQVQAVIPEQFPHILPSGMYGTEYKMEAVFGY